MVTGRLVTGHVVTAFRHVGTTRRGHVVTGRLVTGHVVTAFRHVWVDSRGAIFAAFYRIVCWVMSVTA